MCVTGDPEEVGTDKVEGKNIWRNNGPRLTKVAERSKFTGSGICEPQVA